VFVPCAFISGITGQFFRQFALTIAVSTILSAFNSLTLSPALAALLLKPRVKGKYEALPRLAFVVLGAWLAWEWLAPLPQVQQYLGEWSSWAALLAGAAGGFLAGKPLNWLLGWSFRLFNVGFDLTATWYTRAVGGLLRISIVVLVVYGGLLYLTWWGFQQTPAGFIPQQDKGYLLVNVQLPDAASLERTEAVMARIEEIARATPGVKHTVAISGQSILLGANAPNFGAMYVMLDDFPERTNESLSGDAIAQRLQTRLRSEVHSGVVNVFAAPPVEGLGTAGGFKIIVEDRGDSGMDTLQDVSEQVVRGGQDTPGLEGLFTSFRANTPWLYLDIDRVQAKSLGVSILELFNTLQVNLGSLYVNDFNRFGRTWQVNVQASPTYRSQLADLTRIKVRNVEGKMVPLSTMVSVREVPGPVMVARYNMYPAAAINANAAPGVSSGQAITLMESATRKELPQSMRSEWTELALLQLQTGSTAMLVFALAVVLVFLVLAAQYESWSLPLAVILVVPMCLLCSIAGVVVARMDINIFTQVGFVVLIGLACKNAILIVEFARAQRQTGVPRYQATLEACKLRLRPIVMTSFAFILGVVPLVLSEGAGAEMRRTLGTAVFSGMLGVTLFGIFLTPVFYYVIQWFNDRRTAAPEGTVNTRVNDAANHHS
jgi:hydrophobe/amphiphile efflux-1 (HAE1) family protein